MRISTAPWIAAVLVVAAGVSLSADRVRLRSGKIIEGMFLGGDSKTVRVLLDSGQVSEVPLEDAVAIEFSTRKPPTPAATPTPAASPRPKSRGAGRGDGPSRNRRQRQADASYRGRRVTGRTDVQSGCRRSGDGRRIDRDPARRGRDAAGRPCAAIGHDEGQRQDLPEAALDSLWRHGVRGLLQLCRNQGPG